MNVFVMNIFNMRVHYSILSNKFHAVLTFALLCNFMLILLCVSCGAQISTDK